MNSAIDITSEQRKTLVDLVRQYIPGVAVWAYGSRVKWTARPNSDLDLVVFAAPAQNQFVSELKNALAESELPFLVDLHVWDEIPESFREIIRGEHVVIQEQKAELRQLSPASDWRISTWGEEISLEYGKALRGYSSEKGEYRVYGSNGPIGWTAEPLAPGPGVILGRKGAYRGIKFCQEPFYVIDTAYYVIPKTELDIRWLYYAMVYYKLGEIDDGSPIPSTTRSAVYIREFEIPSPVEQRKIAEILGALDDKIELNRKMNETLEATARAIFKSWFVDFDPVRAKAEGREPEGMDAGTAALFPSKFQDSELGETPMGWKVKAIGDVSVSNRKSIGKEYAHSEIEYVDISSVEPGRITSSTKCNLTEAPSRAKRLVSDGDTIWSCVRPNRRSYALIIEPNDSLVVSTGFVTLTATSVPFSFLYLLVTTSQFVEYLTLRADGAAYPAVRPETFESAKVIIPAERIANRFHEIVEPILRTIAANDRGAKILADLRDTLLPRLISGKLRVPEAEKLVEAVL